MSDLTGQRYLVTGATGGAGSATAALLASRGAHITLFGRDPERTARAKHALPGGGHFATTDTIMGPYHGIFHAAGVECLQPLATVSRETWDKVADPTVGLAIDLLQKVASKQHSIMRDGGAIVMMSSVAAVCGTAGMALYGASKAAIEAICRSAAVELAPRRIRVNCIRAGGFASPMHARIALRLSERSLDDYAAKHPLGFGKAEDVANAAVWLLTEAKWATGSSLTLDGGFSCL